LESVPSVRNARCLTGGFLVAEKPLVPSVIPDPVNLHAISTLCAEDGVQGPPAIRQLEAEKIREMSQRTRDPLASNPISEKRFLAETPS